MTKKWSFIFCSSLNVIANLLMIWPFNNGEGVFSNLFLIIITLMLLPGFLRTVDNQMTSLIRIESSLLIILTVLSFMRLLYRVDAISGTVASTAALIACGLITVLLVAGIVRWIKTDKNHWLLASFSLLPKSKTASPFAIKVTEIIQTLLKHVFQESFLKSLKKSLLLRSRSSFNFNSLPDCFSLIP